MNHRDEQQDGPDDRKEEAGRVKEGAIGRLRENTGNQAAHNRAADSDKRSHPEPHVPGTGDEKGGNETDEESDNNGPDDVEHRVNLEPDWRMPTIVWTYFRDNVIRKNKSFGISMLYVFLRS
jgi:hypothetical protein